MICRIIILSIAICLLSTNEAESQISYETSKALLIYQFAKSINHEKDNKSKTYEICFLGSDIETFNELAKVVENNKVKGKPVSLSKVNSVNKVSEVNLLYIDEEWSKKIEDVWFAIRNKNILLVSEKSNDAKYIMLNILYDYEQEVVSFEINKANLIIEDFYFSPELMLLGGKEVDVRELYREMKQKFIQEKQEVEKQKQIIAEQKVELDKLYMQTDSLHSKINYLLDDISTSEEKLGHLVDSIDGQQSILLTKMLQIDNQEAKLRHQNREIEAKQIMINEGNLELNRIIEEQKKQQEIINNQEATLFDKQSLIETRNKQIVFVSILSILLVFLVIVALYAFRIKKKANQKQLIANKELEIKKVALEETLQKLTHTQTQLVHSEKMASLGVLTAGIAHEINNPINYINSGLEGLNTISAQILKNVAKIRNENNPIESEKDASSKAKKELEVLSDGIQTLTKNIQKGVSRTTDIVKSLSAFSRIDDDKLSLVDIHDNIDSTITLLRNQLKNKIEIIKNYGDTPKIYCYSSKMNQVFMNIISNSIQAIKEKGKIEIATQLKNNIDGAENKYVEISIKDNGGGIPKEIKSKIFEPFYTTKKVGQGTGLGLSISHGIIEQHKGRIEVVSTMDIGTEFKILIPVNKQEL